jgi:hypothetical protein
VVAATIGVVVAERKKDFRREERERERWCNHHVRLLECLVVMKVVVGGTVARIVATEGAAEKEKPEKDGNKGERLVFCQLYT